jgi:hypothetical protein
MGDSQNDVFKDLEPDDRVPEYLKKALVSEIDFIRDTMSVVTLFTSHFFDTTLMSIVNFDREEDKTP